MPSSLDTQNWPQLVAQPGSHDHFVQVYSDPQFLADAVTRYLATGLRQGEGAIVIARPENRARFAQALGREHLYPSPALRMLDAEETLAAFMVNGTPEWTAFHRTCGGAIAEMRLQYPTVRAYGEMVDILWQRGERHAAIRLEEFWNELGRLQTFSLFCAYQMDPLDPESYGGALESVCRCHTHLIPARDYARFNDAVREAAKDVLDQPLAQMLLKLAANHRPHTEMPLGQAALIWLKQNMPRTADRVLDEVRSKLSA
ncbi:MAG TPA: MEDS domain-containing protein [Burkholderiales bacterium]|nr:MEDS domain-containing protein [Burkholderiales bacterium]